MPLFLFGLVKGAVKSVLLVAAVAVVGVSFAYYKVAAGKLPVETAKVVSSSVCRPTPSVSGGALPLTFEAYVKDPKKHNWLQSDGSLGLVERRLEWSLSRFDWVEDAGFAERQAAARKKREELSRRPPEELIKDLRSDDAERREISSKQLYVLTGQTQGYAYDAPKDQRDQGAAAWEKWWANDVNRAKYRLNQGIDLGQQALDLLRRATQPPAEERK